jgi:ribosomal protein L30E
MKTTMIILAMRTTIQLVKDDNSNDVIVADDNHDDKDASTMTMMG